MSQIKPGRVTKKEIKTDRKEIAIATSLLIPTVPNSKMNAPCSKPILLPTKGSMFMIKMKGTNKRKNMIEVLSCSPIATNHIPVHRNTMIMTERKKEVASILPWFR
jgi:hypothetical protein